MGSERYYRKHPLTPHELGIRMVPLVAALATTMIATWVSAGPPPSPTCLYEAVDGHNNYRHAAMRSLGLAVLDFLVPSYAPWWNLEGISPQAGKGFNVTLPGNGSPFVNVNLCRGANCPCLSHPSAMCTCDHHTGAPDWGTLSTLNASALPYSD
eukprot:gene329-2405_t